MSAELPGLYCEACGGKDFSCVLENMLHHYSNGNLPATWMYSLVRCVDCGMAFITPRPKWPLVESFYPPDYGCYATNIVDPEQETLSLKYRIARWRFANYKRRNTHGTYQVALALMVEVLTGRTVSYSLGIPLQLDRDAFVLDVGIGAGDWLMGMRHIGYRNLHGYDIGCNEANIARVRRAGIDVITGDFLDKHYPDGYFDLIRLEHVFEHLLTPKDTLARIHGLLKPGGTLVMNFPGSEGLAFLISPRHCVYRDSPRHLTLHTKRSAERMVKSAGFSRVVCRGYGVPVDFFSTLQNALGPTKYRNLAWLSPVMAPFYKLVSALIGRGDYITVIAAK